METVVATVSLLAERLRRLLVAGVAGMSGDAVRVSRACFWGERGVEEALTVAAAVAVLLVVHGVGGWMWVCFGDVCGLWRGICGCVGASEVENLGNF